MFFRLISASTAMWLIFTPLLWSQDVGRAILAATAGLVALLFTPMTLVSPRARVAVAGAGFALAVANFVLAGDVGAVANFAVCGVLLIAGGLAPSVRSVVVAAAEPAQAAPPAARMTDEDQLPAAA